MKLKDTILNMGLESAHLDELVHDAASNAASDANNGGLDAQLHFLTETLGWTEEAVKNALKEML